MKISTYIFELLQSQDCVIVPNFGAFVARNISAKISSDGSKIFPPNKELSFNKNVVKNDGLLLNAIALSSNPSFLTTFLLKESSLLGGKILDPSELIFAEIFLATKAPKFGTITQS